MPISRGFMPTCEFTLIGLEPFCSAFEAHALTPLCWKTDVLGRKPGLHVSDISSVRKY